MLANPNENTTKSSSGLWDLGSSLIKSINLKELVDGVPEITTSPTNTSTGSQVMTNNIPPFGVTEVQNNVKSQYTPYELTASNNNGIMNGPAVVQESFGFTENIYNTDLNNNKTAPTTNFSSSKEVPGLHTNSLSQNFTANKNVAWSQNTMVNPHNNQPIKQQSASTINTFIGNPSIRNEENETFGFFDIDLDGNHQTQKQTSYPSLPQPSNLSNKNNSQFNSAPVPAPPSYMNNEFQQQKSFGSAVELDAMNNKPATVDNIKPSNPITNTKSSAATTSPNTNTDAGVSGFMGWGRKSLLKFMYPDAHDASENMGKSVEAVYNKVTGRWEFPDDVSIYTNSYIY